MFEVVEQLFSEALAGCRRLPPPSDSELGVVHEQHEVVAVRDSSARQTGDDDTARSFDTLWAWLTLYRRDGEGWKRITDVSTNRPFDQGP